MRSGRVAEGTALSPRFPPWVVAFAAQTFLIQAITFVLRPTAIYRAIELDVPAAWLGVLGASFAVVPLVLAVGAGALSDRYGERPVMVVGGVLTLGAACVFWLIGDSVAGLLTATVSLGVGHLLSVVSQQALVANRAPRTHYDAVFGHYTVAASAGQAVGPALIVLFGGAQTIPDTDTIFASTVLLSVVLLAAAICVPSSGQRAEQGTTSGSVRRIMARPGMLRSLTVSCVVLAAVDISLVYLPVLGAERDLAAGTIGILLTVRAGASMVSRFGLGWLTGRFGRRRVMTATVALAAAGMALTPVPMPTVLLGIVVALMGLGLGAGQPLTMSWIAEATPAGLRGRAMSLRLTGNRVGQVVVPSIAGTLAGVAGASGVLALTAAALGAVCLAARSIPPPTADDA